VLRCPTVVTEQVMAHSLSIDKSMRSLYKVRNQNLIFWQHQMDPTHSNSSWLLSYLGEIWRRTVFHHQDLFEDERWRNDGVITKIHEGGTVYGGVTWHCTTWHPHSNLPCIPSLPLNMNHPSYANAKCHISTHSFITLLAQQLWLRTCDAWLKNHFWAIFCSSLFVLLDCTRLYSQKNSLTTPSQTCMHYTKVITQWVPCQWQVAECCIPWWCLMYQAVTEGACCYHCWLLTTSIYLSRMQRRMRLSPVPFHSKESLGV